MAEYKVTKYNNIKFRAYDIKNGKYVHNGSGFSLHGENFFLYGFGCSNEDKNRFSTDYVNDIQFEQYIGIEDINGKEIYVGDIIQETSPRGNKYKVFNVDGGFAINTHQDDLLRDEIYFYESTGDMQTMSYISDVCEVVGNIRELGR